MGVNWMLSGKTETLIVIPAREKSSRLPGKPLKKIAGKAMIKRVYDRCVETGLHTVVATDSDAIKEYCEKNNVSYVMTSSDCLTGTDRVAEVAELNPEYSGYINVQGDEPFVQVKDILAIEKELRVGDRREAVCGMCRIIDSMQYYSPHTCKVIFDSDRKDSGLMRYVSRSPIPAVKPGCDPPEVAWKQVSIFGFRKHHLELFRGPALRRKEKTLIEWYEDIEVLRFLELNVPVRMMKLEGSLMAVDTEKDLREANELWEKHGY